MNHKTALFDKSRCNIQWNKRKITYLLLTISTTSSRFYEFCADRWQWTTSYWIWFAFLCAALDVCSLSIGVRWAVLFSALVLTYGETIKIRKQLNASSTSFKLYIPGNGRFLKNQQRRTMMKNNLIFTNLSEPSRKLKMKTNCGKQATDKLRRKMFKKIFKLEQLSDHLQPET